MNLALKLALAGLSVFILMAAPANAQVCKDEAVSATSRAYLSRSLGAFPGSWAAWRKEVVARYGNGWQAWRRAAERQIKCEQGANRRWTCTRVARPCRPGSGSDNTPPEPVYEPIDTILKRGMNGEQVKTLQYLLNEAGFELEIDGNFGRSTEKALIAFQRKNGLSVDGRAGPKTIEALTS